MADNETPEQQPLDDYDRFEAERQSGQVSVSDTAADALPPRNRGRSYEPSDEDMAAEAGQLRQYVANGPGFAFATRSYKKLPAGVYGIDYVNDRLTLLPVVSDTDALMRLPDSRSDQLIKEIEHFRTLKKEFKEGNAQAAGGFLHKRGYMLFGPPGSGKTSTVNIVKKSIVNSGGVVIMGSCHPDRLALALMSFRQVEPNREVLVIFEDFDSLVRQYEEAKFLAVLDGENSIDGALFIATTNYVSRFDARMYNRPGRFSDVVWIGMPSRAARESYLRSKLRDLTNLETILDLTEGFSIDHLRSLILGVFFEKRDLRKEAERLRKLFKPPKDDAAKSSMGIKA